MTKEVSLFRIIITNKEKNDRSRLPYSADISITKGEKTSHVHFDESAHNHL